MIIIFFGGIIGIGIFSLFKVRTIEDFLVAGRKSGGISIGGSLAATILGGSGTLGLAGLAFSQGLAGSWWLLVGAVGLFFLLFFVPAVKAFPVYTLPELIGKWYGEGVRKIASVLILFAWLGIVGAQISAAGRILSTLMSGSMLFWTSLAAALFILYTVTGGQLSVIRTDLVQIIFIVAGIVGCALLGLRAVNGFAALGNALGPDYNSFPLSSSFSITDLLLLLLVVGSTYLIGPDMLSRVFCSKGVRAARKGIILSIIVIIPLALTISLIGMEAKALFPEASGEAAFPLLIKNTLPPVLGVFTMLALLSAFLSSADTTLLTMSAIVSVDLLGLRKADLGWMRLITALSGAAALLVGIISGGIISSLLLGYTIFSGGLFIPILAGLTGKVMRQGTAIFCIIAGGSLALAGKLTSQNLLIAAAFAISLVAFIIDRLITVHKKAVD